jgi:hypothetical protein
MKRYLVFAGSLDARRATENTFIGECEDFDRAKVIAETSSEADWYLIYDRTSRNLTSHHRRESAPSAIRHTLHAQ